MARNAMAAMAGRGASRKWDSSLPLNVHTMIDSAVYKDGRFQCPMSGSGCKETFMDKDMLKDHMQTCYSEKSRHRRGSDDNPRSPSVAEQRRQLASVSQGKGQLLSAKSGGDRAPPRRSSSSVSGGNIGHNSIPRGGLTQKQIDGIPVATITERSAAALHNDECEMCSKGFSVGDRLMGMPKCGHMYHEGCASPHLLRVPSCHGCSSDVV